MAEVLPPPPHRAVVVEILVRRQVVVEHVVDGQPEVRRHTHEPPSPLVVGVLARSSGGGGGRRGLCRRPLCRQLRLPPLALHLEHLGAWEREGRGEVRSETYDDDSHVPRSTATLPLRCVAPPPLFPCLPRTCLCSSYSSSPTLRSTSDVGKPRDRKLWTARRSAAAISELAGERGDAAWSAAPSGGGLARMDNALATAGTVASMSVRSMSCSSPRCSSQPYGTSSAPPVALS